MGMAMALGTGLGEAILQEAILQGTVLGGATPQGPVSHPLVHITEEVEETGHKNGEPERVAMLT